ncbi:MAG: Gldg family protein [Limisphaerales bacterium]
MNSSSAQNPRTGDPQTARSSGRRLLVLAPVFVLLGIVLAGIWFKYGQPANGFLWSGRGPVKLSDSTRDLLRHLNAPVEIRFYSVLPPGSAPEALQDFSGRVDRLLSEFQAVNDSQIHVTRSVSTSGTSADAAAADGIHPFNLDKGAACFLGVAVACGEQKESLPQLQPEWEPALEFDLARAIFRVTATPATPVVKASTPVSTETTNEILRLIPDVKGTSLEDGIGILRAATVNKFVEAGAEMEKQIHAAQQQAAEAQNGKSEAEQQAAMKHLQQVQLDQAEKLKAIGAQLQAQISAFEQMKAGTAPVK